MSAYVQEMDERHTSLGDALYVKIRRHDGREMSWREVWDVYSERYPERWAVQMFPPLSELVDDANVYHLLVLATEPVGVTIRRVD